MNICTPAVTELKSMLHNLFVTESNGDHPRVARVQGYVDGYMRALLDHKLATQEELLKTVKKEREEAYGPAVYAFSFAGDDSDIRLLA